MGLSKHVVAPAWFFLDEQRRKLVFCSQLLLSDFFRFFSIIDPQYENQASIMGKWVTTRPPLTRPPWSDSTGRQELPKDSFKLPEGWKWDSGWFLSPEKSLLCKKVIEL